jgi:hypothetical protein
MKPRRSSSLVTVLQVKAILMFPNFCYGSGHVGIAGAIIEKQMFLKF